MSPNDIGDLLTGHLFTVGTKVNTQHATTLQENMGYLEIQIYMNPNDLFAVMIVWYSAAVNYCCGTKQDYF